MVEWDWKRVELVAKWAKERNLKGTLIHNEFFLFGEYIVYRNWVRRSLTAAEKDNYYPGQVVAYTDGSGTTDSKPAGSGAFVIFPHKTIKVAAPIGTGTNNKAELLGIWAALRLVPNINRKILIMSDSEYSLGIVQHKNWVPKKNKYIVEAIRQDLEIRQGNVLLKHVKGHAGILGNEEADKLAKSARKLSLKNPKPVFACNL